MATRAASATNESEQAANTASMRAGITPASLAAAGPNPDLNGRLYRQRQDDPNVWFIDRGQRRWVPDAKTYVSLFGDTIPQNVEVKADLFDIEEGLQIESGAALVRGDGTNPVYLVDQGVKRFVTSPRVMTKYQFDWQQVKNVPPILVRYMTLGDNIV